MFPYVKLKPPASKLQHEFPISDIMQTLGVYLDPFPAARSPKEFVLSRLAILIGAHFTIRIKENLPMTGACGNCVKRKTHPVWWENQHFLSHCGFPVRKH